MARILGLDIEQDTLRGTLIRTAFRKAEVERYVHVPLVAGPNTAARTPEVKDAVTKLLQQLERPADTVVTAIDGRAVSMRRISLPLAAAKRVDEVLPFELEAVLPFDVEDAVIDHQPAGTHDGQLEFLVAAVLQTRIEQEVEKLEQQGIFPRQIIPGAIGLEGLVALDPDPAPGSPPGPAMVALELRRETTEVCIVQDKHCSLARTLSEGVEQLPDVAEALIRGIQQTIASYRAAGGPEPERVLLIGEGTRSDGMARWLSDRLHLPVEVAELPSPTVGSEPDAAFGRAFSLAARASQGGKHMNLRRGRFAAADAKGALTQQINLIATCAIAVLICIMYAMWARQSMLLDERRALSEQLAATTKTVFGRSATTVTSAEKLMENPTSGDPLPRFDAFDALAAVSAAVADDITHDVRRMRIEVDDDKHEGKLELQGSLASIEQRDQIIASLKEHPCFSEIEPGRTTPARGNEAINYQLEAVVQCPGDAGSKKKKKK